MSLVGYTFNDPRSRRRTIVTAADENEGHTFTLEYTQAPVEPGHRLDAHWHESWIETFEVLEGDARYRVGGKEFSLSQGERVVLPAKVAHIHPWNVGSGDLKVRQTVELTRPDVSAIRETIEAFAMLYWLKERAEAGGGESAGLLQMALIVRKLQRHGGHPAGVPAVVLRAVVNALSMVAERRGFTEFDPQCMAR